MKLRTATGLAVVAVLAACESGVDPQLETTLSLEISTGDVVNQVVAGTLHLQGPTPQTLSISPGQTRTISGLQPGNYTVSLEALNAAGEVERFARTTVNVQAGQNTQANLNLQSFVPDFVNVASGQVNAGQPVQVSIGSVSNAAGYRIDVDTDPQLGSAQSVQVSGTSAQVTFPSPGTWYVAARARSPFGSAVSPRSEAASVEVRVAVATVEVAPPTAEIAVGGTVQLEATARADDNSVITGRTVTWSSDATGIAEVDGDGLVTGIAAGEATITATVDGVQGSSVVTVVEATDPPVLTRYDVLFRPVVSTCLAGNRGFRTEEELDYQDANGDIPTGSPLVEPNGIESQYRFEGQADWADFFVDKTWTFAGGSGGASGTLEDASSTCWRMPAGETFVDFRVRVQDSGGNWSDWRTTRLMLPRSIELFPATTVDLSTVNSALFTAEALDANGDPVPGDAINWSSYNGPDFGSITEGGFYTRQPMVTGLDRVFARAGEISSSRGIFGPSAGTQDSWWAPCWTGRHSEASAGIFRHYRMTVFEGREYSFTLRQSPGFTASGDPDLYILMDAKPTTATWAARSTTSGYEETIVWTAPADGQVWIGIYAFTAYANVDFNVRTTDDRCGFPAFETLPAPPAGPSVESGGGGATSPGPPWDGPEADSRPGGRGVSGASPGPPSAVATPGAAEVRSLDDGGPARRGGG